MTEGRTFRLRVSFVKQGRLAMLSHLELARALERAVRRAKLPYAVSNGFSPHMRIAFGAALPVGVGGTAEVCDVTLTSYLAPAKALEALQAASAPDLMPFDCAYVEPGAPAASAAFPVGVYEVRLSVAPERVVVPDTVTVVRKRKEKVLEVADFLCGPVEAEGAVLRVALESKPTGSLRVDKLVDACLEATKAAGCLSPDARVASITRIEQRENC